MTMFSFAFKWPSTAVALLICAAGTVARADTPNGLRPWSPPVPKGEDSATCSANEMLLNCAKNRDFLIKELTEARAACHADHSTSLTRIDAALKDLPDSDPVAAAARALIDRAQRMLEAPRDLQ